IEAALITIWEWDLQTGKVVYSDHYENLFGEPPCNRAEDASLLFERIHPDDREKVKNAINECIENDTMLRLEYRIVWRDQTIHWLQSYGRPNRVNGKVVSMMGILQNITEHKRIRDLELEHQRLEEMFKKQQEL